MTEIDKLIEKIKSYSHASTNSTKLPDISNDTHEKMIKALAGIDLPEEKKKVIQQILKNDNMPEINDPYIKIPLAMKNIHNRKALNTPITIRVLKKSGFVIARSEATKQSRFSYENNEIASLPSVARNDM